MRAMAALAWKEWRQVRWFFFTGVVIFFGIPLTEALQHFRRGYGFRTDMPEGMVLGLGGVLAIFVGVGLTCADLKRGVAYFWQSRPVRVWQWVLEKYVMGLLIVLAICCGSLVMQWYMYHMWRPGERIGQLLQGVLYAHNFTIILLYSLAFLFGSLMRRAVYATIFSIAAGLLVYFLPVLVPALESWSVINIMEERQVGGWCLKLPWNSYFQVPGSYQAARYAIVCVGAGAAMCVMAGLAVKRNWRIRVGQKLMYWSLGAVMLLLLCTFAFQVGSNLKCVRRVPLKSQIAGEYLSIEECVTDGEHGLLLVQHRMPGSQDSYYSLRRFDLSCGEQPVGQDIALDSAGQWEEIEWSAKRPEYAYCVRRGMFKDANDGRLKFRSLELVATSIGGGSAGNIIGTLDLLDIMGDQQSWGVSLYLNGETLYAALREEVAVIDTSDLGHLAVSKVLQGRPGFYGEGGGYDRQTKRATGSRLVQLIEAADKSVEERLRISLGLESFVRMASDGEVAVGVDPGHLKVYRLGSVNRQIATLQLTGWREPTPIERLMGMKPRFVSLRDGFCYVVNYDGGLTVFDVRYPETIKKVGYYNPQNEELKTISFLQDGNVLLCGRSLHIVAPPTAARGN